MEVITTQKPITWPDRLKAMDLGQELTADISASSAARQAISRSLPNSGCEMLFETETIKNGNKRFLKIKRVA